MPTFLIVHKTKPILGGPHYGKLSGAYAHIFVVHDDQLTAEQMTVEYLARYGWEIEKTEEIRSPVNREHCEHDKGVLALFDNAQKFGISAEFVVFTTGDEMFN